MVELEKMAEAALKGEALRLRSLVQDWLRENPVIRDCPRPRSDDPQILTVAAALVELFAERANQRPPTWSKAIGPLAEPRFLVKSADKMKRLRQMCEAESPQPLRRRNLYAPPEFLQFA